MRKSFKKGLALVLSAALALGAPVAVGTQEAKAATGESGAQKVVTVTGAMSDLKDSMEAGEKSDYYRFPANFDATFEMTVDGDDNPASPWEYMDVVLAPDTDDTSADLVWIRGDACAYHVSWESWDEGTGFTVDKAWDVADAANGIEAGSNWQDVLKETGATYSVNVKKDAAIVKVTIVVTAKDGKKYSMGVTVDLQAGPDSYDASAEACRVYMNADKVKYTLNSIQYTGTAAPTASPAPTTPAASGGAVSSGAVSGGATTGNEVSSDNSKLPYSIGASDKSSPFWNVFSKPYVIDANGTPLKINFDVESDMAELYHTFIMAFTNKSDLNEATRGEDYAEFAVIRGDRWGWSATGNNLSLSGKALEFTGDDVNAEVLKNANVTLEISRAADVLTIKIQAVSKTDASQTYNVTTNLDVAGAGDVYCSLTLEKAYVVINSVEGEGTATGNAGNPVVAGQTTKKSLMFTDAAYKSGKVTGTLNAENATVEVQVGSAAAQKATVSGKTFSLNVGTVKAGTTIKITATAEGYMSATKTLTVSAAKKAIKLSGVKAKGKKVTGKVSVKKATVKVKVGKAAYKKAKVSGKKFTLKTKKKIKKGTKVIVKATKKNCKAAKKTVKAK